MEKILICWKSTFYILYLEQYFYAFTSTTLHIYIQKQECKLLHIHILKHINNLTMYTYYLFHILKFTI